MMHITSICVLFICISPSIAIVKNSFFLSGEREILKGELLHTLPVLGKEWKVSFEVNPRNYVVGLTNILHLWYPNGHNPSGYSAAVSCLSIGIEFLRCSTQGYCQTARLSYKYRASEHQHKYFHDYNIPQLDQWTNIEVSQIWDGNSYKIVFNHGAKEKPILNPKIFEGVKVYTSDPWNNFQPGKIRGLHITNLNIG